MQLDFNVNEQTLTWVNKEKTPVADSVKYLTAKFTFSEDWNGVIKSATFFPVNGEPFTQTLEGDGCVVPHEVIKAPLFKVSVFGGELITTNKVIISVIESGYAKGQTPKPPTPDVYSQILEKVTHTEEIAENLVEGESVRVENETKRIEAEEHRQRAEDDRNNNEQLRDEHEINRVRAEQEREQTFEGLKAETESLIADADTLRSNLQESIWEFEHNSSKALEDFATQSAEELEKVQTATDRANEAVENMPNVYANALKGNASGEVISITDISPIEHTLGVKLESKNLFNNVAVSQEINGVTLTVNPDKSVTINGTASASTHFVLGSQDFKAGDYYLSGCTGGSNSTYMLYWLDMNGDDMGVNHNGATYRKLNENKTRKVVVVVYKNVTVNNITIYPMITTYNTTAYTPYVEDVSTTTLQAQGKNLFKSTDYTKGTLDVNTGGITSDVQMKSSCLTTDYIYLKSGAYVLSNIIGANLRYVAFYDLNKGFKSATWTNRAKTFKFTITEDCYVRIDIERDAYVKIDNFDTFCDEYEFMLEVGTKKSKYEKYIEPTSYTPNADGTVEGVKSIYPNTTLYTDTSGVLIECEYNRDINKVIENLVNAIISLGGNV